MKTSSDGDFVVSPVEAEKNGGNEKEAATTQAVQVAVNIQPLIAMGRVQGCKDCITIVPSEPQISTSSLCFCFCMRFHSFLVYGCGLFSMPLQQAFFGDEMDNFFAQTNCHDSVTHQSKQRRFYAIQGVYGFETITQEVGPRVFM
jgi:hypothetical protein